jgi:hypothetical protein
MKIYATLSEAINDLQKSGYTYNFNVKSDCLYCVENNLRIHPDEFEIDGIYRFEGMTDPGDSNILFAISSKDHQIKGLLVNAYGMYSDSYSDAMAEKLKLHKN